MGDDVIDLPAMREVGFAVAVANARDASRPRRITSRPTRRQRRGARRHRVHPRSQRHLKRCIEASIGKSNPIPPSMDIGSGERRLEIGANKPWRDKNPKTRSRLAERRPRLGNSAGHRPQPRATNCTRSLSPTGSGTSFELDAARRVAAAIGVAAHRIAAIDLRIFGGSALTADIPVPKGRAER